MPYLTRSVAPQNDIKNRLLAALSAEEYGRVIPHLASVALSQGQIVHHPELPLEYVYFPETAVMSFVFITEDGVPLEVGTVGNNGLAGISASLGVNRTPNQTEVLIGGTAWRMSTTRLRAEILHGGALAELLPRYAQATIVHSGQMQVCMRLHSLEERLAGWLLLIYELRPQEALPLTQRSIGQMLGVRRSGVSDAANYLLTKGLISYSRGHITICDQPALAEFSCSCSRVIHDEYERVFSV
ncbi:MAG TPA: Crp/Fnr family transcriptional regulator [Pyrinomonadaceae bacterium]|jgi:CRP-like cAMP-binding protein|nr:Crp/Fnr family transcriptional regulator [Pyrinomonadaceae bacterium]